jgi:hypothetical protein
MELELKHIAPYFPYSLKMAYLDRAFDKSGKVSKLGTLEGISHNEHETHPTRLRLEYMEYEHIWMFKPILRPLSEFESESIEDVEDFIGERNMCDAYYEFFVLWFNDAQNIGVLVLQAPQPIFNFFIANHYDVFGLIEAGLAIDINTIEVITSQTSKNEIKSNTQKH